MEKKQKIYIGLVLLLFVVFVIFGEVRHSKIVENAGFSKAHILSFDENYNNNLGRCLTYSFSINGKIFIDRSCSFVFNNIFNEKNDLLKKSS